MAKNILYIESGSGFGGSSVCLYNFLRHLDKDRFRPLVVAYANGPNIEKIKELGIKTLICNGIILFFKLLELIKRYRIDLIHNNNDIYSNIAGILAAKVMDIPCICHIRGIRKLTKRERFFARFVDLFIAVSNSCRNRLIKEGISEDKVICIYDGVDVDEFQSRRDEEDILRKNLNLPEDRPLIGLVSRIAKGKGHEYFIEAATLVLKEPPNIKFLIIGDGPLKETIKSKVKSLGLEEDVLFLGWCKDTVSIYNSLDIVVSSSTLKEAFGTVNLEAMACEKPVIATGVDAYREVVIDKKNGFIIPPGNPQALAEAILKLLKNAELAKEMGRASRKRVEELFDIKDKISEIESLYDYFTFNKPLVTFRFREYLKNLFCNFLFYTGLLYLYLSFKRKKAIHIFQYPPSTNQFPQRYFRTYEFRWKNKISLWFKTYNVSYLAKNL